MQILCLLLNVAIWVVCDVQKTNTLVLISDYTKGLYHDKWIGNVLHYTGMGKIGNQDIDWAQNATLANSKHNGVDVHLFEVMDSGKYIYCGRVELVSAPYIDIQIDENRTRRNVWIFPIQPTPKNDVIKPTMFVFPDMESYQKNKSATETAYYKKLRASKKVPLRKVFIQFVPHLPSMFLRLFLMI